jgi:hypothetical protein
MMMKKLLLAVTAAVALTTYAQDVDHPPVYRGEYYAFDVYPHGYKGYPAFPYYGAPFGYGGPAFAATQQQTIEDTTKEVRSSTRVRGTRAGRRNSNRRSAEQTAR